MIGACLAGASQDEVRIMENVGTAIGLAFQIQDDILDISGDEKVIGKPVHSDEKNEKSTYPVLHGMEESQEKSGRIYRCRYCCLRWHNSGR